MLPGSGGGSTPSPTPCISESAVVVEPGDSGHFHRVGAS